MQEARHRLFRVRTRTGQRRDCRGNQSVRVNVLLTRQTRQDFDLRDTAEQWLDHRLHRHHCSILRAGVAPRLKIVRRREMRCSRNVQRRRFVDVESHTDHFRHRFLKRGPVKVGGGVVDRIPAKHDEGLDRTTFDGSGETAERGSARGNFGLHKRNRLTDGAQNGVETVNERMDFSRQVRTCHNQRRAAISHQVCRAGLDPLGVDLQPLGERGHG